MAYIDADIKIEVSLPEALCIVAALAAYTEEGGEFAAELCADLGMQLGIFEDENED